MSSMMIQRLAAAASMQGGPRGCGCRRSVLGAWGSLAVQQSQPRQSQQQTRGMAGHRWVQSIDGVSVGLSWVGHSNPRPFTCIDRPADTYTHTPS